MTDTTVDEEGAAPAKPSKLPLIIGVVLALAGAGGGFFAVSSGLLGLGKTDPFITISKIEIRGILLKAKSNV